MPHELEMFAMLARHGVPFVVIGGHAVNVHGYARTTEDSDVLWLRSATTEQALFHALTELQARYIGSEIDPASGMERTHEVTFAFVQSSHLMMLVTRYGFLDLFDYVPGLPSEDPAKLIDTSLQVGGLNYVSLSWLRRLKIASGRPKDLLDLENLPEP